MKIKRSLALLLVATAAMLLMLSGCSREPSAPAEAVPEATAASMPEETLPPETEPTEPPPTCPPDGNPDDITCQGSYTDEAMEVAQNAQKTVATIGEKKLTNALLQIYYQMAVNTYHQAGHEIAPDFTQSLDTQLCPLEGTAVTWQQYFLQQALNSWQSHVAMVERSKTAQLPLEAAYGRNEQKHAENLRTKIYNLNLLYGYNTDYKINEAHQAYLDNLHNLLASLAEEKGLATTAALANQLAGVGTNDTYLLEYAKLMNEGYMYATTLSYYIEPTAEEVAAYFAEHEADYAQLGITKDNLSVNLRHILLVPENATVAQDGTVTASDEDWQNCLTATEALMKKWNKDKSEANFADLAFQNSADTGSNINGGLYSNIVKGQLIQELDAWCFDPARQTGDIATIRTTLGYHIVYFCAPTEVWYAQAEADLIASILVKEIADTVQKYPMTVDYSAISLGHPTAEEVILTAGDLLYPDIGHERFPVAPLYFQQDYPDTMYGNYSLVTYGCGVTTMSMLVSYMTDEEWTPPELCALYGKYCSKAGTAHAMFTEVPIDRGFYCKERVFTWKEALAYLEQGYMVVTLQRNGYWTRGGHYLLLHNLIETNEGTMVQVRDSNLYNYKRLDGHTIGYFSLDTIPSNSRCYWVYQKKVMNYDTCARCAAPTEQSHVPSAMFVSDYICDKCDEALLRRNTYQDGCANPVVVKVPVEEPAVTEPATAETVPAETTSDSAVSTETLPVDPDHDFDAPAEDAETVE